VSSFCSCFRLDGLALSGSGRAPCAGQGLWLRAGV